MKASLIAVTSAAVLFTAPAFAERAEIWPNGWRASSKGAAQNFTGSVTVDPYWVPNASTTSSGALVTFDPGARSTWHTHPAGQYLVVTSGAGWVQEEGGAKREIKPGDVVWTPPGVKHWHGAKATTSVSHIAITNVHEGKSVEWMEHVADEQYTR
jgi:quercetin dioxygenase-like cupin family protein